MNTNIGAIERVTQNRLIGLFENVLKYTYLGNWEKRENNSNVEEELLRGYLTGRKDPDGGRRYTDKEIGSAVTKFKQAAGNIGIGLYNANKEVYRLLRYGVNVNAECSDNKRYVQLIDWNNPAQNDFQIAEEVTVHGKSDRRPDLVVYINGIALAVIELKRSRVSVHEGIRQNIRNQQDDYIPRFFTTVQFVFAGNDTEGLHYGVIRTPEKFWLRWKEPCGEPCEPSPVTVADYPNELDRSVLQFFDPKRLLEYIHDFIVFDGGIKKAARPNQYFAVKAAQPRIKSKEGGVIWHSQGAGKSLMMVWLAQWIRENVENARIVIITDRDELDKQIESGFKDAEAKIERAKSGERLIEMLNAANPWLICTLIHKFGNKNDKEAIHVGGKKANKSLEAYLQEVAKKLPAGFRAKGNLFVFVDECHRTQGGLLHGAMRAVMGDSVMLVGFTGTPLLREDKKRSVETFGTYIHSYRFNEAVADGVILDLRYEARNVEQYLGKREKIDEWFDTKTVGLSRVARAQLKSRWAKMEKLFSSKERIQRIVADICQDMDTKRMLSTGCGNAMLVADSIYQACRYWEVFQSTDLKGHCAVVTSYDADSSTVKDEYVGEGETEALAKYEIYKRMIGDKTPEQFEAWAKTEFIDHPKDMKLLIVVDKLLTGFDAPAATYLYIDKRMHDHNLFQAVCRVNRVDSDEKDYGYIVDYQDLFGAIKDAIKDYTNGAFELYSKEDVDGLLTNRLAMGRQGLEDALQAVVTLCEVVTPQTQEGFFAYFVYDETTPVDKQQAESEANTAKRETLYKLVGNLVRRYIDLANEMIPAGYTQEETEKIKAEVEFYNNLKDEIKLKSGDALDLKSYDPAMRQLIDNYVRAEDSEKIIELGDMSFLELIDLEGKEAIDKLPQTIKQNERSVAELLAANMRKMIISERPNNPAYFDKISDLLNQLLQAQKEGKMQYKELIEQLIEKIREVRSDTKLKYPKAIDTKGKRALYDNLGRDEALAVMVHNAVKQNARDGFRDTSGGGMKMKALRQAVKRVLPDVSVDKLDEIMQIIIAQSEY
ncbi:type I restriction endonuclease subunit R [Alistipes indistinctus]|uniref:type I restriction endonuclease subunit R n=1 Tax=Alistipes indistinctus TaxID=626932 RepID=UPI0026DB8B81|nr:HsdR family type I site-specific deoxyribonuclease [Alistipes indistinctus]